MNVMIAFVAFTLYVRVQYQHTQRQLVTQTIDLEDILKSAVATQRTVDNQTKLVEHCLKHLQFWNCLLYLLYGSMIAQFIISVFLA